MSLFSFLKLSILLLPLCISQIDVRIHDGFIDFEHNKIIRSDVALTVKGYTLEISLNDSMNKDYALAKCYFNKSKFLTYLGCFKANDFIVGSFETDSYTKNNTKKQTLIFFRSTNQRIIIKCDAIIFTCQGCAERSCHRGVDVTAHPTEYVSFICEENRAGFICNFVGRGRSLLELPTTQQTQSGNHSRQPEPSRNQILSSRNVISSAASVRSTFINRYSWTLIFIPYFLFFSFAICFGKHLQKNCFKVVSVEAVLITAEQDRKFEKNDIMPLNTDCDKRKIVNASTFTQVTEIVEEADDTAAVVFPCKKSASRASAGKNAPISTRTLPLSTMLPENINAMKNSTGPAVFFRVSQNNVFLNSLH